MDKIETRTALISLVERGIVLVKYKSDIVLDKPDIIENVKVAVKLSGGRHCAILKSNINSRITNQALRFAASKEYARHRIANAVFIKTVSIGLFWEFFVSFFISPVHSKIFTVERKAIQWLRGFVD